MFSLPLPTHRQSFGLEPREKDSQKRKRGKDDSIEQQNPEETQVTSPPRPLGLPILTPDDIHQYSIAGQPLNSPLLPTPFPHTVSTSPSSTAKFDYLLRQSLKPHPSASTSTTPTPPSPLHHQHIAVITTILHRSLLTRDFTRASRALGMMLRDSTGGEPIDIRSQGRWGIGAEILMRKPAQTEQRFPPLSSHHADSTADRADWITRQGLDDLKKYYQRLSVQFPYFKRAPLVPNALDFYPAMFGVWIYVVHCEARRKIADAEEEDAVLEMAGREDPVGGGFADAGADDDEEQGPIQTARGEELLQAKQIAERMDSVLRTVPFMELVELVELRRMVGLWIRDLEGPRLETGTPTPTPTPTTEGRTTNLTARGGDGGSSDEDGDRESSIRSLMSGMDSVSLEEDSSY